VGFFGGETQAGVIFRILVADVHPIVGKGQRGIQRSRNQNAQMKTYGAGGGHDDRPHTIFSRCG
jgi:hypothetical protein